MRRAACAKWRQTAEGERTLARYGYDEQGQLTTVSNRAGEVTRRLAGATA
ncbi:hypothetical protein SL267_22150 [Serratia marcescens]|nr:hypothetical protein [Serratia marcescens]BCZ57598.1 hypothetical protein SL267_22150 [Serratia marcescens]